MWWRWNYLLPVPSLPPSCLSACTPCHSLCTRHGYWCASRWRCCARTGSLGRLYNSHIRYVVSQVNATAPNDPLECTLYPSCNIFSYQGYRWLHQSWYHLADRSSRKTLKSGLTNNTACQQLLEVWGLDVVIHCSTARCNDRIMLSWNTGALFWFWNWAVTVVSALLPWVVCTVKSTMSFIQLTSLEHRSASGSCCFQSPTLACQNNF